MINDYFKSEEFKETLRAYENGLAKGDVPELEPEDFLDIGDYYQSVGNYVAAEMCVDYAMTQYPDEEELLVMKCSCCICQKKFDEVKEYHQQLDPTSLDVMYQRAQLLYAVDHNYQEATALWHKWMELTTKEDSGDTMERDCYMHIIASVLELCDIPIVAPDEPNKKYLDKWLKEYKAKFEPLGDSDYDEMIADSLVPTVMSDDVIEWYTEILERRPYMPRGWARLAVAHLISGNFDQCIEAADFALAINPDDIDSLVAKANAMQELGQWEESLQVLKEVKEKGGNPIHNINIAQAYLKVGDPVNAFHFLDELKDELNRLMAQFDGRDYDAELDHSNSLFAGMSKWEYIAFFVQICMDISDKLKFCRRYKESNEYLEMVLKYNERNYKAYQSLAENYFALGEIKKGVDYMSKALENGGKSHLMENAVLFCVYLLAYENPTMCYDMIQKCEDCTWSSDKDILLLEMCRSYYYLFVLREEEFFECLGRILDQDDLTEDAFFNYFPVEWSKEEKIAFGRKNFLEMRRNFVHRLNALIGKEDDYDAQYEGDDSDESDDSDIPADSDNKDLLDNSDNSGDSGISDEKDNSDY